MERGSAGVNGGKNTNWVSVLVLWGWRVKGGGKVRWELGSINYTVKNDQSSDGQCAGLVLATMFLVGLF